MVNITYVEISDLKRQYDFRPTREYQVMLPLTFYFEICHLNNMMEVYIYG